MPQSPLVLSHPTNIRMQPFLHIFNVSLYTKGKLQKVSVTLPVENAIMAKETNPGLQELCWTTKIDRR